MSDTPRTDGASLRAYDIEGIGEFQAVHVQVSRQLERELAAANAKIAELQNHLSPKPIDERKEEA